MQNPSLSLGFTILLAISSVLAQEQPARFAATSNVVMIDVRVLDSNGQPMTGLRAEDFRVSEEGVVQKMSYFREISLPLTTSRISIERTEAVPQVSRAVPEPEQAVPDKRLLILLFNFSSAGPQEIQMMGEAAERFLDNQFTEQDAAAVLVLDNGLEMLTDLTSDRRVLGRALRRLSGGNAELDASLPDEEEDASETEFVADETEFALFQTNQELSAIQSIANAFREVAGRKALVYFSSGLRSRGVENDEQMRWTTDLCNRANISVYSVDARGLVALSPGGGAHRAGNRGTGIFNGREALNQLISLSNSQEGLITLAADTGGAALIDDNDLSKIFRQAQEDASHYYLIGYQSPTPPSDGRFRRIEVQARVEHARLDYRRGYYADKPYRALSSSEREFKLLEAVLGDYSVSELPVEISAEFFPDPSGQYKVPVLLAFNRQELISLSGAEAINLEVVVLARDEIGLTRAGVRDRLEIRKGETGQDTVFVYQNLLVLEPGRYEVAAYLRDNRTGLLARVAYPLTLPPLGPLQPSSLVLAAGWQEPDAQSAYQVKIGKHLTILNNPLEVSGRVLIPRVGSSFHQRETLYLLGRILEDGQSKEGEYRIILTDAVKTQLFQSEWRSWFLDGNDGPTISARIPLSQLSAGRYELVVETRLDNETLQLVRSFDVN